MKQLDGTFTDLISIGQMKGKDFIPSHDLAMTDLLIDPDKITLSRENAIRYLRKETFILEEKEDGWYLACYDSVALGWIKLAGGKMKNHYPKAWMIRKRW